ncbi:hypothetical protein CERSUDRAFT_126177 [Gelatoporia subvermispora B]|uniref:Uncharacterized protein n=1 Tax=Ceriporiopsis subvermispora (strain B) TaxID=914234 RepID=M2Q9E3_CERS8|nr:hypothetical protein CERSUDRAFT_126177 [Gelatoporia subvermispora B]
MFIQASQDTTPRTASYILQRFSSEGCESSGNCRAESEDIVRRADDRQTTTVVSVNSTPPPLPPALWHHRLFRTMGPQEMVPVVDIENPLYCPGAHDTVHSANSGGSQNHPTQIRTHVQNAHQFPSFVDHLECSLDSGDPSDLVYQPIPAAFTSSASRIVTPNATVSVLRRKRRVTSPTPAYSRNLTARVQPRSRSVGRRSGVESFSDLLGPVKYQRSELSLNEDSFELSAKAERLHYFPLPDESCSGALDCSGSSSFRTAGQAHGHRDGTRRKLERKLHLLEGILHVLGSEQAVSAETWVDELYGPKVGTETPRGIDGFVSLLDRLLPGIRLKERVLISRAFTHQEIVNVLGREEIEHLDMRASIADHEGLNLDARGLLHVFGKPNSFLFLKELNLSDTSIRDYDIVHIHHLPRLSHLWLSNTGIGNESIYHLVALRRTLAQLDVSLNPEIDDDVTAPLILLTKLQYLSLLGTAISMVGLRRLTLSSNDRPSKTSLDLEVPRACEDYLYNLHKLYVVQPGPSLIVDPAACEDLLPEDLRRNLDAHAAVNPDISIATTYGGMIVQLTSILSIRKKDLAVRDLVWKIRSGTDEASSSVGQGTVNSESTVIRVCLSKEAGQPVSRGIVYATPRALPQEDPYCSIPLVTQAPRILIDALHWLLLTSPSVVCASLGTGAAADQNVSEPLPSAPRHGTAQIGDVYKATRDRPS